MLFPYDGHQIWFDCHGSGTPLILLHGNTASSSMFDPVIPLLADEYQVITLDFLGCGQSDRLPSWPADLWYEWAKQVNALCRYIGFEKVNLIGSSGGALAAINAALEYPQLIRAMAADSFAGITADPDVTIQIQAGRAAAKQDQGFRAYLQSIHGEDWEQVLDADTDAILRHSEEIGSYFHHPLTDIQARLLLTGSEEDEMFPRGHYRRLFRMICRETPLAESHIFPQGYHPAMLSNTAAFLELFDQFQSL